MTLAQTIKNGMGSHDGWINSSPVCITLNPALYKFCARRQLKYTLETLNDFMKMYCGSFLIIAELTQRVNIHYHLLCKWTDKYDYAREMFEDALKGQRQFGNTKISNPILTPTQYYNYLNYVLKEVDKTDRVLNNKRKNKLLIFKLRKIIKKNNLEVIYNNTDASGENNNGL